MYFTGRTEKEFHGAVKLCGSIQSTEQKIKQVGGIGYGIRCDHKNEDETKVAIDKIM